MIFLKIFVIFVIFSDFCDFIKIFVIFFDFQDFGWDFGWDFCDFQDFFYYMYEIFWSCLPLEYD